MSYPKHKPAFLDERMYGGRESLYNPNFDLNGKRKNWEGIEAAQSRRNKTKTPEQIAEGILYRLHARLRVANGKTRQIDRNTGMQVSVDQKITKNLFGNLLSVSRRIRSLELRDHIQRQVREIREGFKEVQ